MDLLQTLVEQTPNLLGLVVLAVVLYRQNNRLMEELFSKIDELSHRVAVLEQDSGGVQ